MHHNKLQAVNASNDNLNSGPGGGSEPHGGPAHQVLSREASLKKTSDGKSKNYTRYFEIPQNTAECLEMLQNAVKHNLACATVYFAW